MVVLLGGLNGPNCDPEFQLVNRTLCMRQISFGSDRNVSFILGQISFGNSYLETKKQKQKNFFEFLKIQFLWAILLWQKLLKFVR